MNVIAEIQRINERELELGVGFEGSWHQKYKESAWVYVGGLAFELTEGDVLCVMSQFGEIEDINLVRDGKTGKSKGFAFIKYENWLSTVLAVDNMNGARLLERVIRVDHVLKYKLPKEVQDRENEKEAQLLESGSSSDTGDDDAGDSEDDNGERSHTSKKTKKRSKKDTKHKKDKMVPGQRGLPGHAYEGKELATGFDISQGQNVFDAPEETKDEKKKRKKKEKKEKKKKKESKSLEQKQIEWMEQVRLKRQAQREQEERERERAIRDGDYADGEASSAVPKPSESGWRGRLEPTAPQPRRSEKDPSSSAAHASSANDNDGFRERERKRRAAYGGINRLR